MQCAFSVPATVGNPFREFKPTARCCPAQAYSRCARRGNKIVQRPICAAKKQAPASKGFGNSNSKPKGAQESSCPCGSGATYNDCCRIMHTGAKVASTPEDAVRSRFSAYCVGDCDYLADTTHPENPEFSGSKSKYMSVLRGVTKHARYWDLKIIKSEPGSSVDDGSVTFKFSFVNTSLPKDQQKPSSRVETSRFVRQDGVWRFLSSTFDNEATSVLQGKIL